MVLTYSFTVEAGSGQLFFLTSRQPSARGWRKLGERQQYGFGQVTVGSVGNTAWPRGEVL